MSSGGDEWSNWLLVEGEDATSGLRKQLRERRRRHTNESVQKIRQTYPQARSKANSSSALEARRRLSNRCPAQRRFSTGGENKENLVCKQEVQQKDSKEVPLKKRSFVNLIKGYYRRK